MCPCSTVPQSRECHSTHQHCPLLHCTDHTVFEVSSVPSLYQRVMSSQLLGDQTDLLLQNRFEISSTSHQTGSTLLKE